MYIITVEPRHPYAYWRAIAFDLSAIGSGQLRIFGSSIYIETLVYFWIIKKIKYAPSEIRTLAVVDTTEITLTL